MASSSSRSGSCGFNVSMSLEELQFGVVETFKPTDSQLVGHYLYNELYARNVNVNYGEQRKQAFPELDFYGANAMVPWDIWNFYQEIKIPHQDFMYFFSRVKILAGNNKAGGSRGKKLCRKVGSGGTWSETEPVKPVYVDGVDEPFGKMRKFRYENKDKGFEQNGAWMMEEFSIDHSALESSDLVLCRLKRNESNRKRKRKVFEVEEDESARRTKCFEAEEQVQNTTDSYSHEQQQEFPENDPREMFNVDDLFSDGTDQHTDVALEKVVEDTLAPPLSEQHAFSSSLQPNYTEESTYEMWPSPQMESEWHQPIDVNGLYFNVAETSNGNGMQQWQQTDDQSLRFAKDNNAEHANVNGLDFNVAQSSNGDGMQQQWQLTEDQEFSFALDNDLDNVFPMDQSSFFDYLNSDETSYFECELLF